MSHADELHLYATNEGDLYRDYTIPVQRRMVAMKDHGTYTRAAAVQAFPPMVEKAAQRWNREFGRDPDARRRFTAADKREAAEEMARRFEVEHDLGGMSHHRTATAATKKKKSNAQIEREIEEALDKTLTKDHRVSVRVEGAPKPIYVSPWMTRAQAEHAANNHRAMIKDRGWTQVVEIEDENGSVTRLPR